MQRILALTLVILAVAFGQSRTQINYINETTVVGVITNLPGASNALAPVIYAFWVPENSGLFQFTLTNTNDDDCDYMDYYLISDVAPCYDNTFNLGNAERSLCNNYVNSYSGSSSVSYDSQPGYQSSYYKHQVGHYVYIGVGPEGAYTGEACTYTLSVDINSTCAAGQAAAYEGDDLPVCYNVVEADATNFSVSATGVNTTNFYRLWSFDIPTGVASISFTAASTEYFYLYGSANAANSGYSSSYYDCSVSSSSNSGTYYATLNCYTPESGTFYTFMDLSSSPDDTTFNFNITSSLVVCPPNMLGRNCEFPAIALNITNLTPFNVSVPYNSSNYYYAFMYFDIPAMNTWTNNVQINFFLNNITDNEAAYMYVTKNTIPIDGAQRISSQYQYFTRGESEYWVFSWQDWAAAGRVYIGLQCYNGQSGVSNCNFAVSSNSTSTTSGTTGTTGVTGTVTTGTTGVTGTVSTGVTGTVTTGTTGVTGTVSTTSGNVTITTSSASAVIATAALVLIAALF